MSIRLRTVSGIRIAVCAANTKARPGDVYLDDAEHYALARKFAVDYEWEDATASEEGRLMLAQEAEDV